MPVAVGSFVKSTSTSVPVVQSSIPHGLGVTPKAMILMTQAHTAESFRNNAPMTIGFVDEDRDGGMGSVNSNNAEADSVAARRISAHALSIISATGVVVAEGTVTAWDDTNFTITWTTNNAVAYLINFLAIGGDDVESQLIDFLTPNTTGNLAVTGAGFEPELVLFLGRGSAAGTLPIDSTAFVLDLGATDGTNQWAMSSASANAAATSATGRAQLTDACLLSVGSTSIVRRASIVSLDADGFTINLSLAGTSDDSHTFALCLRGVNAKVGAFNKATGTPAASNDVDSLGFDPEGVMLASFMDVAQSTFQNENRFGLGFSDGTTEGAGGAVDEHGETTTDADAWTSISKAFQKVDNNTQTIDAEADVTMESDGFDVDWTTNDAVATQLLYMALSTAQPIAITIGPVVIEYAVPALDIQAPTNRALGPVAYEYATPGLVHDAGPNFPIGPVAEEYTTPPMEPPPLVGIGPVVEEYTVTQIGLLREEYGIGPVVEEYTIVALTVDQDVTRELGPVRYVYTVITPTNDAEYARDLGPVLYVYTVNAFNIRQAPEVIRVTTRYPTVFVHSAWWPRQQLAVLTSAYDVDRSFVGVSVTQSGGKQTGQASVSISASDAAISPDVLRHGNLLVIESPGMPIWAGPILTVEEDDAAGAIDLGALSIEALLDGRVAPQGEEYGRPTGEASIFRSLIDTANARNQTGILPALSIFAGRSVEQLQVGGQSVMEALNEMTARTGSEWWVDVTRTPQRLDATVKLGARQGIDLSGTLHLYQRVHFTGVYKSDLSQVRSSVTAVGDFGHELPDRHSVAVYADAPGVDFGAGTLRVPQGERVARAVRSRPAGLRNEAVIREVMTGSINELAAVAQRAHERPIGAGEMFMDEVNTLVDWNQLRVGNYWTRHGEHQGRSLVRVVRIVGMQPDEGRGVVSLVSEAKA